MQLKMKLGSGGLQRLLVLLQMRVWVMMHAAHTEADANSRKHD